MNYAYFYTEINIFALVIIIMIVFFSKRQFGDSVKERLFRCALYGLALFLIFDASWILIRDPSYIADKHWAMYVTKSGYFYACNLDAYFTYLYFKQKNGEDDTKRLRERVLHTIPPNLIHIALIIINIPTGILFYLDENNVYQRGPLFNLQYLIIFSYLIAASVYLLREAKRPGNEIDRDRLIAAAVFPLIPLVSAAIQYFFPTLPVNNVGFTAAALYLYMSSVQTHVSTEPLTGLFTRRYFMRTLSAAIREDDSGVTLVFMADVNDFKGINDKYGHPEGDRALKLVAKAIKKACAPVEGRTMAARFGGDEFMMAVDPKGEFDPEKFKKSISDNIAKSITETAFPASFTISVGYSYFDRDNMHGAQDFLNAADKALYLAKNKYHGRSH